MTFIELTEVLAKKKVSITVDANDLVVRASGSSLSAELMKELKEHKAELIELLRKRDGVAPALEYSAAELPLTSLGPDELAKIAQSVPGGAANMQDVYPLAPLQEGILFHYLMSGE